jgi:hypothetical protein
MCAPSVFEWLFIQVSSPMMITFCESTERFPFSTLIQSNKLEGKRLKEARYIIFFLNASLLSIYPTLNTRDARRGISNT